MTPNQHSMTYTLNSGIKGTVDLSSKQVQEWIKAYQIGSKFVTVVGKQYFGLNPELVADFKVHNQYSEQREHISIIQPAMERKAVDVDPLVDAYNQYKTLIQVECKCGASYIEESPHKRTKWSCRECNNIVFLDRKKGQVDTERGRAWYMTNKYYVER